MLFFFHVFEDRISHKGHSFKTFCFEVIKARLRKGSKAPDLGSPLTLEPGNVISPAIPFTYYTCCFLGLQWFFFFFLKKRRELGLISSSPQFICTELEECWVGKGFIVHEGLAALQHPPLLPHVKGKQIVLLNSCQTEWASTEDTQRGDWIRGRGHATLNKGTDLWLWPCGLRNDAQGR